MCRLTSASGTRMRQPATHHTLQAFIFLKVHSFCFHFCVTSENSCSLWNILATSKMQKLRKLIAKRNDQSQSKINFSYSLYPYERETLWHPGCRWAHPMFSPSGREACHKTKHRVDIWTKIAPSFLTDIELFTHHTYRFEVPHTKWAHTLGDPWFSRHIRWVFWQCLSAPSRAWRKLRKF